MKIGILTHHTVVNFGAFLQAYALQETVKKLYPCADVRIINFIHLRHFLINTLGWFLFYKNRQNVKHLINIYSLPFTLKSARKKHMHLTPLCFTGSAINRMNFDTIIVGSDEVWNYGDHKSFNAIKFGYGLDCRNLISYAPSAGNSDLSNIPAIVSEGLKRFNHISARDMNTKLLAEKVTGRLITEVLDPTFLYPLKSEPNPCLPKSDYILFYYCEHLPEKIKKQIWAYAEKHNLKVFGAGESDCDYDQCTVNMTPFQWIDMFRHARFIFTGTFHGAVFAILDHRQFKVHLTNKGRIAKVGALLDNLGITDRMMGDDYEFDLSAQSNEIDYDSVQAIIKKRRVESIEYLKKAIDSNDDAIFR